MSSISKNIFDIYTSIFYQCVVVVGLIVATCYLVWEISTGSINDRNVIIDIWAIITCITYIMGKNSKYKYMVMWIVLFSQLMLALWIVK